MRTWRKLYSKLLDSPDIAGLSDGAIVLLTFLIAAQDDSGYYPDDDTSIRRLTVTRPAWSRDVYVTLRDELITTGIARLEAGGVVLVKGEALNGLPRKDVDRELYLRDRHVNATSTPRQQDVALEQSRVEKSREEKEPLSTEVRKRTHTLPLSEEGQTVWPDWYGRLWDIPGFKTPLKQAQAWLDAKAIPVELAETTAYALKSKWPGPSKSPYRDVWATFQTWCKRGALQQNGATNVNGAKGTSEGLTELAKFGRAGKT